MGRSEPPETVDVVVVDVLGVPARPRMPSLELAPEAVVVETADVEGDRPSVLRRRLQVIGRPSDGVNGHFRDEVEEDENWEMLSR